MPEEKDTLPSAAEKGSLKLKDKQDQEPSTPPPDNKKAEQDLSEQPS